MSYEIFSFCKSHLERLCGKVEAFNAARIRNEIFFFCEENIITFDFRKDWPGYVVSFFENPSLVKKGNSIFLVRLFRSSIINFFGIRHHASINFFCAVKDMVFVDSSCSDWTGLEVTSDECTLDLFLRFSVDLELA